MKSSIDHMEDIFDRFDEAYEELLINDSNEARAFLADEGYDLEKGALNRMKIAKKNAFKITAIHNKQKDESLLEKAYEKLQSFIVKNRELAKNELKNLLQRTAPAYQFRNLEKLDDESIRELLTEVDLVKFLEELDKEDKM